MLHEPNLHGLPRIVHAVPGRTPLPQNLPLGCRAMAEFKDPLDRSSRFAVSNARSHGQLN